MKPYVGQTLLLRQQKYNAYYLPTVAVYLGKKRVGKFPFSKTVYQVKDKYPIKDSIRDSLIGYETLTMLSDDYQTIGESEEEQCIRQRLKRYCTI
jgi:hypothetical protein